jgi:Ca2+-binding RTX toxin-like protein
VPASPELIDYTLRDFDGDTAASTLTINILPPQVITLTSSSTPITTMNMGLSGEYYGYNDSADGTINGYSGNNRIHLDDDSSSNAADWRSDGIQGNLTQLSEIEAVIEGRDGRTNIINEAVLARELASDATFSMNKLEFGMSPGTNTPLFSSNLGLNNVVTAGNNIGSGNNLTTFLNVSTGSADSLKATSGLGNTTDAIIRMVGFIYIPAGGVYDLRVTADDGFRILIGGQNVAQVDQIQSTATSLHLAKTLGEGLQPIEILYWDQGGHASFRVEVKQNGSPDTSYKIIGNDEYALFSPGDAANLNLTANQDIVETATNGSWAVRTGETRDGTDNSEKIIGSDGKDNINAGAGNDIVQGGAGSDTIYGGQGSDVLTGGLGSDTFAWSFADQGTVGSPAKDTIADFNVASKAAGGDVLDLRDLLPTATTGAALDAYLNFSKQGADTVIDVKPDGTSVTQKIVLSGVDLGATGVNDVAIINDLIAKGKLVTD